MPDEWLKYQAMPKLSPGAPRALPAEGRALPAKGRAGQAFEGALCAWVLWFAASDLGLLELVPPLRRATWLVLAMALVGALLGLTRARPWLRGVAGASLGLWLLVGFTPLASALITPLKREDVPRRADAVVVLQAGIQRDGDFDAPTLERMVHGMELLHGGWAPRIIVTEDPSGGSNAAATGALMRNLGIHAALLSVGPVHTTHDEALLSARLCQERGWKTVLLVTSPAHSKRAALTFQKTGLNVISSPCRESSFDFENLSASDAGGRIRAFSSALREIIGLRTYRSRGWA